MNTDDWFHEFDGDHMFPGNCNGCFCKQGCPLEAKFRSLKHDCYCPSGTFCADKGSGECDKNDERKFLPDCPDCACVETCETRGAETVSKGFCKCNRAPCIGSDCDNRLVKGEEGSGGSFGDSYFPQSCKECRCYTRTPEKWEKCVGVDHIYDHKWGWPQCDCVRENDRCIEDDSCPISDNCQVRRPDCVVVTAGDPCGSLRVGDPCSDSRVEMTCQNVGNTLACIETGCTFKDGSADDKVEKYEPCVDDPTWKDTHNNGCVPGVTKADWVSNEGRRADTACCFLMNTGAPSTSNPTTANPTEHPTSSPTASPTPSPTHSPTAQPTTACEHASASTDLWCALSESARLDAELIGWDKLSWNQCLQSMHLCIPPTGNDWKWTMLSVERRGYLESLGWTQGSWNQKWPKPRSLYTPWCSLGAHEIAAARSFGWSSVTWDCFVLESSSPTLSPTAAPTAQNTVKSVTKCKVVLNEASLEFIEIFNPSERVCSTGGFKLSSGTSEMPVGEIFIPAGAYLILNASQIPFDLDVSVNLCDDAICMSAQLDVNGNSTGMPCNVEYGKDPCIMRPTPNAPNEKCYGENVCPELPPQKSGGDSTEHPTSDPSSEGCFGMSSTACTSVLTVIYGFIVAGYFLGRKIDGVIAKQVARRGGSVYKGKTEYAFIAIIVLNIMDMLMDAMVLVEELSKDPRLENHYYASIASLVISAVVNCAVVMMFINRVLASNEQFFKWFQDNTGTTSAFVVLSFLNAGNIQIISSRIGGKDAFCAPFTLQTKQSMRVFGIVSNLLEDLPQVIIIIHANMLTQSWGTTATLSVVGSILALCFGLIRRSFEALVARHSSKHRLTSSTVHPGDDSSKKRRLSASFMEKNWCIAHWQ